jgi:hypothetical protein
VVWISQLFFFLAQKNKTNKSPIIISSSCAFQTKVNI